MTAPQQHVHTQRVYQHLAYKWSMFGIGLMHLWLAMLPALAWAIAVSLISPGIFAVSPTALLFAAAGCAAVLDAFAGLLFPSWPRWLVWVTGVLPSGVLLLLLQLPLAWRAALPLWPCLPLFFGGLAFVLVLQYRRDAHSLALAWHFWRSPKLLSPFVAPRGPVHRPCPVDRAHL